MFLVVILRLHVPSIIRYLSRNCKVSCRDPDNILKEFKGAQPPELIAHLKRVLCHHNPTNFIGNIRVDQRRKSRVYSNNASVYKKMTAVETTLNKEERKKIVVAFPCWIEKLFPGLFLTPQGFIFKEVKIYRLVFDGSFLETPFSTCISKLVSIIDDIELYYGVSHD